MTASPPPVPTQFQFRRRARGIVWVCDLADSAAYLNDDETVSDLEEFLQRFGWIVRGVVASAKGQFIKWTGDGFLAWFETDLHRDLRAKALIALFAAYHLSFLVNVTQLGLTPKRKFTIRHGFAYEHDALVTTLSESGQVDLIGRAVVLAFRIAGISTGVFPKIVCHDEIVKAIGTQNGSVLFGRLRIGERDRLKYFKGERFGTDALWVSRKPRPDKRPPMVVIRETFQKLDARILAVRSGSDYRTEFSLAYAEFLSNGPEWAREVLEDEVKFLRHLVGILEELRKIAGELGRDQPPSAPPVAPTGPES